MKNRKASSGLGVTAGRACLLVLAAQLLWLPCASEAAAATLKVVHAFNGDDGSSPRSLSIAPDGTIYGTTAVGGGPDSAGTVFQLTSTLRAAGYRHKMLHAFSASEGNQPLAGVTPGPGGDLFGVTSYGGTGGYGTVFRLIRPSRPAGLWKHQMVKHLNTTIGELPLGGIIFDEDGNGYGATSYGGEPDPHYGGTIYRLIPPTTAGARAARWTYRVLRYLPGNIITDSRSTLVRDAAGNLYGTSVGTSIDRSRVYQIPPGQRTRVLYSFPVGVFSDTGLVMDDDGMLYGTTQNGGSNGGGMVFSLTPPMPSQNRWRFRELYGFAGPDGSNPTGGLLMDSAGTLYGTTQFGGMFGDGSVFQLRPPLPGQRRWRHKVLIHLDSSTGSSPLGTMVMDAAGTLIGTAALKGPGNNGTVFRVVP